MIIGNKNKGDRSNFMFCIIFSAQENFMRRMSNLTESASFVFPINRIIK